MCKKSSFRGPFEKQHGKRIQTVLKSERKNLYHISWSLRNRLSFKNFLLGICKILRLFVNAWLPMRSILFLIRTIQRNQFRRNYLKNKDLVVDFIFRYGNIDQILNILKKKDGHHRLCIFENRGLRKTWIDKCLKSHVPEDPLTSNIVNALKHCWNLHDSTFIVVNNYVKRNWVGKSLS